MSSPSTTGLWSRFVAWAGGRASVADARSLLQQRVALFFQLQFVLGTLSLLWRLALGVSNIGDLLGHTLFVLVFLAAWLRCRRGERSQLFLHVLEAGGTVFCCAVYGLVIALVPELRTHIVQGAPYGWHMFLIVVITLVTRAALIPSSTRRSLLVGFGAVMPIVVGMHFTWSRGHQIPVLSFPQEVAWIMMGWGISFVIATTVISQIIYGLQARVRQAMRLGQYTLEEKLGEGGMGVVYRARHAMMRRPTAVKLLPSEKAGDQSLARFEREVQLTAQLTHPNTITIFDYGRTSDGVFYYAMELLEGATLEKIVELDGPQPPARVLRVLRMVAGALSEAHEIGLIHRDIKPANILLCKQGGELDVAKVLDFGLVKAVKESVPSDVTQEGSICGTPQYMSPESLLTPDKVDARADLYALGAVGYFMLTGGHMFEGDNAMQVFSKHLHTVPPPPSERMKSSVPTDLQDTIMLCLEKDPEDRPRTAKELTEALYAIKDVAEWRSQEAEAWWKKNGAALVPASSASSTAFADTIAIQLPSESA